MTAKIIDGNAVARSLRADLKTRLEKWATETGTVPGLAVLLVGDDPASAIYVRNKARACDSVGIRSFRRHLPAATDTDALIGEIRSFNADPQIHGILVQLPLPAHVDSARVLGSISVDKDVDGFHLYNVGSLAVGTSVFPPCTPYGVVKLLDHELIPIEGQNVVVVGASNIVGKPMGLMLMRRDATVTICHVKTRDLAQFTILADILIVAAGKPRLILPQMVRTGAVVIDVGINRLPDGSLVGDVDFEGVRAKASYITPVPGGVGPMTITMLLENTFAAAVRRMTGGPQADRGSLDELAAREDTGNPRL